jgi:hypothetical protein
MNSLFLKSTFTDLLLNAKPTNEYRNKLFDNKLFVHLCSFTL